MLRVFGVDTNVAVAGLIATQADNPSTQLLKGMFGGRPICLLFADPLHEYPVVSLRPKHAIRRTAIVGATALRSICRAGCRSPLAARKPETGRFADIAYRG
ncbi:MAG: hypothetical protein NTW45_13665 [Rhodocyclales bacterium]|nr:hypothetical protein [Rhodocyclales bacterium]